MIKNNWYETVRDYTQKLVGIRSVSPGTGEIAVAEMVLHLLCADDMGACYTVSGLDPLEGDRYGRQNAYAFLQGRSSETLVLLGHIDTVDTKDYGPLEPWSLEPQELAKQERLSELIGTDEALGDWMFGRGVADMKSGVAIIIALMRRLAEESQTTRLPLSVVMLATPDEENESAGVLQAVQFLLDLRERYGLTYLGAINTDYVTSLYPGDPHRYIYSGTVGKLLPSFLCIGRESHVGTPFNGLDANLLAAELIRDLSMNDELCETVRGQITAPPVTLKSTDLKTHYDVQLPFAAYFYLNVLTLTTGPGELLERLQLRAETVLKQLLARVDRAEQRWRRASNEQGWEERAQPRSGAVLTYGALYHETVQRLGEEHVLAELRDEWERCDRDPVDLDRRERSLKLVYRLWKLSGRQGPAVVLYYSPPYYPHVTALPGRLQEAVSAVVQAHPDLNLEVQEYFPYLSDMSYLRLDPGEDLSGLKLNMPLWQSEEMGPRKGAYRLPLEGIQQLGLAVVNWGPYGQGAHQRDERVLMPYSFGTLPQLLYETIEHLALLIE